MSLKFLFMFQVQECNEKVCILLNFRAQDKAALQLSELEEEMDQRIQAAEYKTRKDVSFWVGHSFQQIFMRCFLWRGPRQYSGYHAWVQQVQLPTDPPSKGIFTGGVFWGWGKKK